MIRCGLIFTFALLKTRFNTYFDNVECSEVFLDLLNGLHPALRFTCEHEKSSKLLFLDVLVEKSSCEVLNHIPKADYPWSVHCARFVLFFSVPSQLNA